MRVRLVQLFAHGVRRSQEECRADAGQIGNLRVFDNVHNADRRPLRQADLTEPYPYGRQTLSRSLLPPLFDAELIRVVAGRGLLLRGVQFDSASGATTGFVQEWWCEPISPNPGAAAGHE